MKNGEINSWEKHDAAVVNCRRCPRLVAWREEVAETKRKAFANENYWGKPVPGFGDHRARVLVLGLAPGAHGSNRTGRMFTGDASGDFLFPALYKAGFASQPEAVHMDDGLKVYDLYITAVCRCAPPGNHPSREEQKNCFDYLYKEIALLKNLKGIVALGGIAFNNAYDLLQTKYGKLEQKKPKFGHLKFFSWENADLWLLASYHPSRQNTQTGRLTDAMFAEVWKKVRRKLEDDK